MLKNFTYVLFGLIANWWLVQVSLAQDSKAISFRNNSEGISHYRVQAITQDREGFLWVGTYGGLNKYDGFNFEVFQASNKSGTLPNNDVRSLLYRSTGELWVGTLGGIAIYKPDHNNFEVISVATEPVLTSNSILALEEDHEGKVWIGTSDGLYFFDDKLTKIEGLAKEGIQTLAVDSKNRIWAGSTLDLYVIEEGSITKFTEMIGWNYESYHLIVNQNDQVLIGTRENGMAIVEGYGTSNPRILKYEYSKNDPASISSNRILRLYEDSKGDIWVGTENGGLNLLRKGEEQFIRYDYNPTKQGSISAKSIWNIFEDNNNRIWIAPFNQGLDVYDPKYKKFNHVFQQPGQSEGLSSNNISCFLVESESRVWIGTDGGGVNIWDRDQNSFEQYIAEPGNLNRLQGDGVLDLLQDSEGNIWVAAWAGGLSKYIGNNTFETFLADGTERTISNNNTFAIAEDANGYLWVASFGGVDQIDKNGRKIKNISEEESNGISLTSNQAISILVDSKQRVWVGTQDGLNKIVQSGDDYQVENFWFKEDSEGGIPSEVINTIFEDARGRIWIGTKEGLARYHENENTFSTIRKEDGLPSSEVLAIFQQGSDSFWVTTNKGIALIKETTAGFDFRLFDKSDGLQGDNFNRGAYLVSSSGTIFLGGNNGFNYFQADDIQPNEELVNVVFSELKINGKIVDHTSGTALNKHISAAQEIRLSHEDNVVSIAFSGLSFTHPEKNQYAIRLRGFEDDWNFVGNQRNAGYTNLDPGDYTFMVKAANNDGIWNEEPAMIRVTVLPAWWETWLFRGSLLFTITVLIILFVRARSKTIQNQKKELELKVKEATEDVLERNKALLAQQDALNRAISETNEVIERAANAGDFSARITLENKEGEWLDLANSVNSLLEGIVLPLTLIGDVMKGISLGDLTKRFDATAEGEILDLKESVNRSLISFSELLLQVKSSTLEIASASTEMRSSSEEMHTSTTEITSSISEISSGVNNQVSKIDEVSSLIENLRSTASSIDNQASTIQSKSKVGNDISNESLSLIEGLVTQSEEALHRAEKTALAMEELKNKSRAIAEITSIIREIAGQTNLLSLNASIQAAQAGEAGRGFTVVAEEVRKLADSTQESLHEIEGLIKAVQEGTEESAFMINEMAEIIRDGKTKSNESMQSFSKLAKSNEETLAESQSITDATRQQSNSLSQIMTQIETVVVIAEQSAAGTDQIAASCEELSAGMTNYNLRTKEVLDKVDQLLEMISFFKMDQDQ